MNRKTYDHTSIKILENISVVQKNPGMFIGSTENPTHLLTEIFDNAQDEAVSGHATLIAVIIDTKKKEYSVLDNGRGIPIDENTIEIVATKLFSGGKFEKSEDGVYTIATGLHGVGIVAVTALSEYFTIEVYRNKKHALYSWKDSVLVQKDITDFDGEAPFSTRCVFKPKKKYFTTLDIDINYIRKRMKFASVHVPDLKLALIVDGNKEFINCNMDEYFKEDILESETSGCTPIQDIQVKVKDEKLDIRWCYSLEGSPTPKHHGCINILTVDQGTHINLTNEMFKNVLYDFAKKKKMNVQKQDCIVGFRAITSLLIYKPEFTSQNKERFDKKKDELMYLYSKAQIELEKQLSENEDLLNRLLYHFDLYRKRLDSSKNIIKTSGTVSRALTSIGGKLRDCNTHSVEKSELFIVEGDSAGGIILSARNPEIHAILPLKGKSIPNVAAASKDFLKGRTKDKKSELVELINACGTGIEPHFNISGIRYGKIIISCDADSDGFHIATIIMIAFLKLMPEIIRRGYLYLADMPLYGARNKNGFVPLYTDQELEKYKKENPKDHIVRFKGLGEMNSEQLSMCLLNTKTRRLIKIQYPENEKKLFDLMVDPNLKRQIV